MNISKPHGIFDQQTLRLLRIISTPFLIVETGGTIVWVNTSMTQLLDMESNELIGKPLQSFSVNDEKSVSKLLKLFSSSGNWLVGSLKLRKPDGSIIDFPCDGSVFSPFASTQATLINIRFNQQLQFGSLNRKIEELNNEIRRRMRVEAALRESEVKIRTLVDCSPLAIQVFAPDGSILRVNKAWERIWQTSLPFLRGYNVLKDQQLEVLGILALLKRVFQGESIEFPLYEYDKSLINPTTNDKSKLWLHTFAYPVITGDGRIQEIVLIQEDVSEKVMLERELEQHRHHLETLIEARTAELRRQQTFTDAVLNNISDGVVACDEHGLLSLFNRATIKMHGIDQQTLPPEQWANYYRLLQPDGVTRMTTEQVPLYRAFQGKVVKGQELIIERMDGSKVIVLCSGQTMVDKEGRKIGAVVSMHDITLEKLAQEQMIQAKETAEAANRAKSVFLANVSHELRTPLNAILGFAQLMEHNNRIPEDQRRNIAIIDRAGNHLLSLINDVLEICRIEAGRAHLVNEIFDLSITLKTVQEVIRPQAETKNLVFSIECSKDLPHFVRGDEHHLRQVLLQLLRNAVKYTEHGAITLTLKLQSDQTIFFKVTDTGCGIPAEQKERIFEPFYQIEGNATKGEGAGLGLSLSQKFVSLMGGELDVESTVGQGSTFCFSLSLPRAKKLPRVSTATIIGLATEQLPPRILIADDNLDNQLLIKQLLESIGCVVAIANNGLEAIERFQSFQPELLLMDIRMPIMDGYAATRAIRSMPNGEKLPILALTGSTIEEDQDQIFQAGCNDIIGKPVDANHLYNLIGRLLNLKFEYAPETPQDASEKQIETSSTLSALAQEQRQALANAAEMLDLDEVQKLAVEMSSNYPKEAELISGLLENFRFDELIKLCKCDE